MSTERSTSASTATTSSHAAVADAAIADIPIADAPIVTSGGASRTVVPAFVTGAANDPWR